MTGIMKERQHQLDTQRYVDREIMRKLSKKCPLVVVDFLLWHRNHERKYAENVYVDSIYNYPENTKKYVEFNDEVFRRIKVKGENIQCFHLNNIMDDMDKSLPED